MGLFIYYRKHSAFNCLLKGSYTPLSFAAVLNRKAGAQPGRRRANPPPRTSILRCWGDETPPWRPICSLRGPLCWWKHLCFPPWSGSTLADCVDLCWLFPFFVVLFIFLPILQQTHYPHGVISIAIPMVQNHFAHGFPSQDPSFSPSSLAGNDQSCFREDCHNWRPVILQSSRPPSPVAALSSGSDTGCTLLLSQPYQACKTRLSIGWRAQLNKMHH